MKRIYCTTMKSSLIALSILLASCTTDVYEPKEEPGPSDPTNGIPNDFDFSTVTKKQLVVNVPDEYDGRFYYTVEVYNKNPNTDESAKILVGSKTNKNTSISTDLIFPKFTDALYVVVTDPYGHKGLYAYDIKDMNGTITLNPGTDETPKTKAGGLENKDVDFTVPSTAVEIKNNGTKLEVGGVYKITESDYNGEIKFPDGAFTLYVSKKLRLNDNNGNKNKQYLLHEGGKIYVTSTGIIEPNGGQGIDLKLAGRAELYNAGSITVNTFDLAKDDNVTNSILFNEGTINVNQLNANGALIYNHCLIHAGSINLMGAGSNIYEYAGAILVDNALTMNAGTAASGLYLSAKSLFKAKAIKFEGTTTLAIHGDENGANLSKEDFPLLHVQEPVSGGYSNQIDRAVEVFGDLSSSYPQIFSPAYQTVGDKPNAKIEASSCNGNTGYNPDESTGGDQDSEYEEVNTPSYTYMFEDNWPSFGDYDMNDLVMDINITNKIKGGNATQVTIKTTLRAVGATKDLYAYAQIEAEGANNIIVPLLLDQEAHQALKVEQKTILNTITYNCESQTYTNSIPLTGVQGRVHVKNLNVFIVWGDPTLAKRNEIHLPGFKGTSQAAPTGKKGYQYDGSAVGANPDFDNMMWGLMVPTDDFISYPRESVAITEAYKGFWEWALQGGNETVGEWYKSGDISKLYQGKAPNAGK